MIHGQFAPYQRIQFEGEEQFVAGLSPLSLVSDTGSAATTIAWAGVAAGRLAVLFDYARAAAGTPPTDVTPTGFSSSANWMTSITSGLNAARARISYKILTGSESGSITGMAGASDNSKRLFIFEGAQAIVSAAISTTAIVASNTNPAAVVLSTPSAPAIVIGLASAASGTPAFSTASPAFDATSVQNRLIAGYKLYDSSPAAHTIDMNAIGVCNILFGGYLELS